MGNVRSGLESQQILLLGLENSGKTLFLKKLTELKKKETENSNLKPTLDYNYINISQNNSNFDIWDLSGDEKFKVYWPTFYRNLKIDLVIYFINVFDEENNNTSIKDLLVLVSEEELKNSKFIIIFNLAYDLQNKNSSNNANNLQQQVVEEEEKIENLKMLIKNSPIYDLQSRLNFISLDISKMKEGEAKTVDLLLMCSRTEKK